MIIFYYLINAVSRQHAASNCTKKMDLLHNQTKTKNNKAGSLLPYHVMQIIKLSQAPKSLHFTQVDRHHMAFQISEQRYC